MTYGSSKKIQDITLQIGFGNIYSQKPNIFNLLFALRNFSIHLSAKLRREAYLRNVVNIVCFIYFRSLMKVLETTLFMLFQMNSIGFKSGEYGGRNNSLILHSFAHCIESFARWDLKLSRINTISSLGLLQRISLKNSHTSSFFECSLK
jgi:hypothetical protein